MAFYIESFLKKRKKCSWHPTKIVVFTRQRNWIKSFHSAAEEAQVPTFPGWNPHPGAGRPPCSPWNLRVWALVASLLSSHRAEGAKAASMCGPLGTVAAMTTATAMATPLACGPSPSTRLSTTAGQPCTTRAAPPPWPPPSAMEGRGIPRPEW